MSLQTHFSAKSALAITLAMAAASAPVLGQGLKREPTTLREHLRQGLQGDERKACRAKFGALEKELLSGLSMAPAVIRAQSANHFLAKRFRTTLMADSRTSRLATAPEDCQGASCAPWDAMRTHGAPFNGGGVVYHCPLSARQVYVFKDECRDKAGKPLKSITHTDVYLDKPARGARMAATLTQVSGVEKTFRGQEIVLDRLSTQALAPLGQDTLQYQFSTFAATKVNGRPSDDFLEELLPVECQRPRSVGPVFAVEAPAAPSAVAAAAR
jgi:hypothetical protein